jgi:hypothetical protein
LARSTGQISLNLLLDLADPKVHSIDRREDRPGRFSPTYCLDHVVDAALDQADRAFREALGDTSLRDLIVRMTDLQRAEWQRQRDQRRQSAGQSYVS